MEYRGLIGSYGRLTKEYTKLLRSEILGSGIQDLDLDLDLNLDLSLDLDPGPDWS